MWLVVHNVNNGLLFVSLQLIDMTPAELQWLASHLGHDVSTHKKNYRMHSTAIEITKVGRLLMNIDEGNYESISTVNYLSLKVGLFLHSYICLIC
jgi:hypothetical protein